ncbi:DUF86 domain-containing protein [Actinotalea sp. C106]|uniref:HepT-like ribonuclease domain-containing protein n=1 Tax=Actinotalea sp. C106 TaxID=2908644 RepID=UPI002029032D|nr:HepT-like ribonuclease domain-containing protein [Actinotalea sp. C106]
MQRDALFIAEMTDACVRIIELVAGQDAESIDADATVREALYWNFTVLGEAAGRVSAERRQAEAGIPWHRAAALRNRIVHGYWSVDTDLLVATARDAIPQMMRDLRTLALDD